jgi:DNA-binding NtrC family response regulator
MRAWGAWNLLWPLLEFRLGAADLPLLCTRKPGSGKEPAAEALYAWSSRRPYPFHPVNCASYSGYFLKT